MTFDYRQRSPESVEHVLRLHRRAEAIRLAYHDKPKKLCALLRAEGQDDIAELIEDAKGFRKRSAPVNERTEIKQWIVGLVRSEEKRLRRNGEPLGWGTRPRLIKRYMALLADDGELDLGNPDDDAEACARDDLYAAILKDLGR